MLAAAWRASQLDGAVPADHGRGQPTDDRGCTPATSPGWLRRSDLESPRAGFSAPLMLRFAIDDLKAYALEAAAAGSAKPSSEATR